jgi:pimeloyl-ACP methyl ester carboxylesterase
VCSSDLGAREAFDRLFPGAEPQTAWLEAGHWVHAEKPDEFARLVGQPFA